MSDADSRHPVTDVWHQQDILAAVRKRGATISSLNRNAGYKPGVLRTAFYKRFPKGNRLITEFIGEPVEVLWPHWFGPGGSLKPLQGAVQKSAA